MDGSVSREVFGEGDLVVYPNHGAGHVAGVEEKTVLGEERRYYIVYIADGGLTLNIPADGETGLRLCSDEEGVTEALSVLQGDAQSMPANWNHRLKHNQEKLRSGEISRVAEVVRDLSVFGGEHGLSTGERTLLAKARRILISEVALVRDLPAEEAEALVDGALRASRGG
ncbi:MAG: CarD family transcriptional regulator [Actinomycetota bacterium]|nr:CarD family transcriptional regulator [Actinomycetota bacterium]